MSFDVSKIERLANSLTKVASRAARRTGDRNRRIDINPEARQNIDRDPNLSTDITRVEAAKIINGNELNKIIGSNNSRISTVA